MEKLFFEKNGENSINFYILVIKFLFFLCETIFPDCLAPKSVCNTFSYEEPALYMLIACQKRYQSFIPSVFFSYCSKDWIIKSFNLLKSWSLFRRTNHFESHQSPFGPLFLFKLLNNYIFAFEHLSCFWTILDFFYDQVLYVARKWTDSFTMVLFTRNTFVFSVRHLNFKYFIKFEKMLKKSCIHSNYKTIYIYICI